MSVPKAAPPPPPPIPQGTQPKKPPPTLPKQSDTRGRYAKGEEGHPTGETHGVRPCQYRDARYAPGRAGEEQWIRPGEGWQQREEGEGGWPQQWQRQKGGGRSHPQNITTSYLTPTGCSLDGGRGGASTREVQNTRSPWSASGSTRATPKNVGQPPSGGATKTKREARDPEPGTRRPGILAGRIRQGRRRPGWMGTPMVRTPRPGCMARGIRQRRWRPQGKPQLPHR